MNVSLFWMFVWAALTANFIWAAFKFLLGYWSVRKGVKRGRHM